MVSVINICTTSLTFSKRSLLATSQWNKQGRCNYAQLQAYKLLKSPTQCHQTGNRLRKDPHLQMYSPGASMRTHLCTKSYIESKSAFITFYMKHPSSGLMTHHVQRCLRRVMTPSVPRRVGYACREWGEGRVKVHSVPAPVSVPILHLDHSLHCSWSPSTQSHGHFLDHICQDWAIPNIPFFHL